MGHSDNSANIREMNGGTSPVLSYGFSSFSCSVYFRVRIRARRRCTYSTMEFSFQMDARYYWFDCEQKKKKNHSATAVQPLTLAECRGESENRTLPPTPHRLSVQCVLMPALRC